jgi:monoterpene epsilon-lactone hydrolase
VSTEQRETLDAILRQSAFPAGSDVNEQRRLLRELLSAQPLPADVTVTAAALGGVPTAEITVDGIEPRHVVLYFHGGVYVMGDAFLAADLASQVGRRTDAKVISVDYRLAPEHPYPAAVDDALAAYEALLDNGIAPSDIAFAGESAGGGLAVATLVNARDHGLPLPAAAFVMSPYADLTLAGATIETRREADPLLSRELLQPRVTDYTSGQDAALGLISPVFAYLPLSVAIIGSSALASRVVDRLTPKPVLVGGLLVATVGFALFTRLQAHGDYAGRVLPAMVVMGVGLGMSFVPVTIAATSGVAREDSGLASGLLNTTQQVGGSLGLAVLSAVSTSRITSALHSRSTLPAALTHGFTGAFTVSAILCAVAAVLAIVLLPGRRREPEDVHITTLALSFARCPGAPYCGHLARVAAWGHRMRGAVARSRP